MAEIQNGYTFEPASFAELLIRSLFPERTPQESSIIRDYLLQHLHEFDRVQLSFRVGKGVTPDPTHLPSVQTNAVYSSKKRIDILAWRGSQPLIVEVKQRVNPAALGQLLTYRHLFMEDYPDADEPELLAIGRYSDDDTLRALSAAGIPVYLYPAEDTAPPAAAGGV